MLKKAPSTREKKRASSTAYISLASNESNQRDDDVSRSIKRAPSEMTKNAASSSLDSGRILKRWFVCCCSSLPVNSRQLITFSCNISYSLYLLMFVLSTLYFLTCHNYYLLSSTLTLLGSNF